VLGTAGLVPLGWFEERKRLQQRLQLPVEGGDASDQDRGVLHDAGVTLLALLLRGSERGLPPGHDLRANRPSDIDHWRTPCVRVRSREAF
jgi:hypothetical protein